MPSTVVTTPSRRSTRVSRSVKADTKLSRNTRGASEGSRRSDDNDETEDSDSSTDALAEDDEDFELNVKRKGRPRLSSSAKKTVQSQGRVGGRVRRANSKRTKTSTGMESETEGLSELEEEVEMIPAGEDNFLYEALLDYEASLPSLVSDFLESYQQDSGTALMDLVNCVLRCCGFLPKSAQISSFDIQDVESVAGSLTQIQDKLKNKKGKDNRYPLISTGKEFKHFKKQLNEFWFEMMVQIVDKDILDDGTFLDTVENWIVSMSSSTLRAMRHTATTIALSIMSSFNTLSAKAAKDLLTAQKQLATEQKKSRKNVQRVKTLTKTIAIKETQAESIQTIVDNLFDSVFQHRYRDTDAKIRAECIHALGIWMETLPSIFFESTYTRYLGWMLSDLQASVRLEVIKILFKLYSSDDFYSGLRQFTERFQARILEIAMSDAETPIRVAALQLISKIRARGFMEDEDVEKVLTKSFDEEDKIRLAVSVLLKEVVDERQSELADEILEGEAESHGEVKSSWIYYKVMAQSYQRISELIDEEAAGNNKEQEETEAQEKIMIDVRREKDLMYPSRIRFAASSFLLQNRPKHLTLNDLSNFLLYDNDATAEPASNSISDKLKTLLLLTPDEEIILLDVLVSCAAVESGQGYGDVTAQHSRKTKKVERATDSLSEQIIEILPKLLSRFKKSEQLLAILPLITFCDISIYSKLRKGLAFADLLSSISTIFFGYNEDSIMKMVAQILLTLQAEDSMESLFAPKINDLLDIVSRALVEAHQLSGDVQSESELEMSLKRLDVLASITDCANQIDEVMSVDEFQGQTSKKDDVEIQNGQPISAFRVLKALLSHQTNLVRDLATRTIRHYLMWKIKHLVEMPYGLETRDIQALITQRDDILFILDSRVESGDAAAAMHVAEIEVFFINLSSIEGFDSTALRRPLDDTVQLILLKHFRRCVKRYSRRLSITTIQEEDSDIEDIELEESSDDADEEGSQKARVSITKARKSLRSERALCEITGIIIQALCSDKMDLNSATKLLKYRGHLGHNYDALLKRMEECCDLDSFTTGGVSARRIAKIRTKKPRGSSAKTPSGKKSTAIKQIPIPVNMLEDTDDIQDADSDVLMHDT